MPSLLPNLLTPAIVKENKKAGENKEERIMRHGGEKRGNSADRRARKLWMIVTFGNGTTVLCIHCSDELTFATVEADRIIPGGSYRRDNVQPACRKCNLARSNNAEWELVTS